MIEPNPRPEVEAGGLWVQGEANLSLATLGETLS